MGDKYIAMKLKDQERSLAIIEQDPELQALQKLRGPLLDLEVRGTAALQYFGDMLWAPAFDAMAASERISVLKYTKFSRSGTTWLAAAPRSVRHCKCVWAH